MEWPDQQLFKNKYRSSPSQHPVLLPLTILGRELAKWSYYLMDNTKLYSTTI